MLISWIDEFRVEEKFRFEKNVGVINVFECFYYFNFWYLNIGIEEIFINVFLFIF